MLSRKQLGPRACAGIAMFHKRPIENSGMGVEGKKTGLGIMLVVSGCIETTN